MPGPVYISAFYGILCRFYFHLFSNIMFSNKEGNPVFAFNFDHMQFDLRKVYLKCGLKHVAHILQCTDKYRYI